MSLAEMMSEFEAKERERPRRWQAERLAVGMKEVKDERSKEAGVLPGPGADGGQVPEVRKGL